MADEEIPRDPRWAIPLVALGAVLLGIVWFWTAPTLVGFLVIGTARPITNAALDHLGEAQLAFVADRANAKSLIVCGALLSEEACLTLLRRHMGQDALWDEQLLCHATKSDVITCTSKGVGGVTAQFGHATGYDVTSYLVTSWDMV